MRSQLTLTHGTNGRERSMERVDDRKRERWEDCVKTDLVGLGGSGDQGTGEWRWVVEMLAM